MDKKELREKYIRIGVITSPHGIKGEVNVFPTTNDKEMFKTLESCYMLDKNGLQPKKVMGCKYFKKLVILQFEDVVDRNTSETLRQKELYIARDEANILARMKRAMILVSSRIIWRPALPLFCRLKMQMEKSIWYQLFLNSLLRLIWQRKT